MESIEDVVEKWNLYSTAYATETEPSTVQSAVSLYNITSWHKVDRILDAGCGPGLGIQSLVSTLMKKNAKVYWIDIAEKMLEIFEQRFTTNDYGKNGDNVFKTIKEEDIKSIEDIELLESQSGIKNDGKGVFLMLSNTEKLAFPDDWFDAYTSNLCLQITPNHMSMLKECYRVLKPDSKAAFTVWGREENCSFITLIPEILEKYGIKEKPWKYWDFHLNNTEQTIKDMKSVGFKHVKYYYFPTNHAILNGEQMWHFIVSTPNKYVIEEFDEETQDKIKTDIIDTFEERYGQHSPHMVSFETMIFLCVK